VSFFFLKGPAIGFSLALSLRRYVPGAFGTLSLKRCFFESAFMFIGYGICSRIALKSCLDDLGDIRIDLIRKGFENFKSLKNDILKRKKNSN
jgi:hypothetical protein